jgi:hypothetical protein
MSFEHFYDCVTDQEEQQKQYAKKSRMDGYLSKVLFE